MISTKALADTYMSTARRIFVDCGEVMPILAFHGGPSEFLIQLAPGPYHPSDQAVAVTFAFATVIEASFVVAVNETWVKRFDADIERADIQRGDLERMHEEGDPGVHTALLVIVADTTDQENSIVATRDMDASVEEEEWTHKALELGSGSYLDRLLHAWEHGRGLRDEALHGGMWLVVAEALRKADVISSVVNIGRREDIDDAINRLNAEAN